MSKAAAVQKVNEKELELGLAGTSASWHQEHISSPTIYIGGLSPVHDESHILAIFEQYGTIVHLNLVRHADTKKSKLFAFAMYADPRSAILAVDNLNAIQLNGNTLSVDHVDDYRLPEPPDAFDTTPRAQNPPIPHQRNQNPQNPTRPIQTSDDPGEHLREEAVMHRLKKLQKRRRIGDNTPILQANGTDQGKSHDAPVTDDGSPSQLPADSDMPPSPEKTPSNLQAETEDERNDRRRRRIEKDKRRAERAAIRKARAERRARRQQDQQSLTS